MTENSIDNCGGERGLRRPYLEFRDEDSRLLGLTGPFRDHDSATAAQYALTNAERLSVDGLDLDAVTPDAQCIFAPYNFIRVIDLSPQEIRHMSQGQTEKEA